MFYFPENYRRRVCKSTNKKILTLARIISAVFMISGIRILVHMFAQFFRYYGDVPVDLPVLLRQSSPKIPILLLYKQEGDTANKLFTDFANRKQNKFITLTISDNNPSSERTTRRYIQKAMAEVRVIALYFSDQFTDHLILLEKTYFYLTLLVVV